MMGAAELGVFVMSDNRYYVNYRKRQSFFGNSGYIFRQRWPGELLVEQFGQIITKALQGL